MPKTTIILQARTNSTRLPGKVLKKVGDLPMILFQLERLNKAKLVDEIIVATSNTKKDDELVKILISNQIKVHRSCSNDVLRRYANCLKITQSKNIMRITGDCPFIDPKLVDESIEIFNEKKLDYLSNNNPPTFPDGLDIEIFTRDLLKKANKFEKSTKNREHVTPWIKKLKNIKSINLTNDIDYSFLRWTVDEPEDLKVINCIVSRLKPNTNFSWLEVIDLYKNEPHLFSGNKHIQRNEGIDINMGQKVWKRARKVIPGGNMLLSKRPDMFLPNFWPSYFSKAKGINVWDLENKKYRDISIMGVGTNILGYGNAEVDKAVKKVIKEGNMSTLNCYEEVLLAEKLIQIHPWGDMVRFARTGGEANAIAVRIARAANKRDKIAICGYHGWHDWYLATNLQNKESLNEHLLPGLSTVGIPKSLEGSVIPFPFNNIKKLKSIIDNNELAAIKMEVERSVPPNKDFLEEIRQICDEKNIILIFDECTSGFRETYGGLHKKYLIEPDICIFGKALGNGYAITAVLGKEKVMKFAQDTFISSTFWTERIGPAAALKTLEIMENLKSWEIITKKGVELRKNWIELANKYSLDIQINGIAALSSFNIKSKNEKEYKTLITQEMLKKGFLASNICYLSTEHDHKTMKKYLNFLENIFKIIAECEDGRDIQKLLNGPTCSSGFKRLN